ncbi:PucR family transcriptional regulator [Nocardioides sp.]|uniref:PucR family transcriptional regulator n=1 Tax=Nocardioides sp. TaxID=35761 RepID=UPI003D0B7E99
MKGSYAAAGATEQHDTREDLGLAEVARLLTEHSEDLVGRQVTALRERFVVYRQDTKLIPDESLMPSALRNVRRAAKTMVDGKAPSPDEVDEAWVGRERAEQGMAVGEMMDGYRLCHSVIRDGCLELGGAEAVAPATMLKATKLLWETADACSSQIFLVRRAFELTRERFDEERKLHLVRGLLRGSVDAGQRREFAASFGLDPDGAYIALRGMPLGDTTTEALRRRLESSSRNNGRSGLVVIDDGVVLGIVPRPPRLGDVTGVVGVSHPGPFAQVAASYQSASQMSHAAERFGLVGVFGPDDLGLRVAIASEPGIAGRMVERYFGPLRAGSHVGAQIEETVRAFLAHDRNPARTARLLGIHPNTLRYRLRRFEQLVGVDLDSPRCLAELWWAIEAGALVDAPTSPHDAQRD